MRPQQRCANSIPQTSGHTYVAGMLFTREDRRGYVTYTNGDVTLVMGEGYSAGLWYACCGKARTGEYETREAAVRALQRILQEEGQNGS